MPSLLDLLDHPSQELKSYAAITFGNLSSSGAIPQHQLEHPSVLPHLVNVLTSSNGLAKGPAAGAIASMCSRPELRRTVFELGGLPGLVALLSGESDTSYHAVQAVAQFAADEAFRVSLRMGARRAGAAAHRRACTQCTLSATLVGPFLPSAVAQLADAGALLQVGQMLFGRRGRDADGPHRRHQRARAAARCNGARGRARAGRRPRRAAHAASSAADVQTQMRRRW